MTTTIMVRHPATGEVRELPPAWVWSWMATTNQNVGVGVHTGTVSPRLTPPPGPAATPVTAGSGSH